MKLDKETKQKIDKFFDSRTPEELEYLYKKYDKYNEENLTIPVVSKSLRNKEQFIELAKMIEIHIQKSVDYQASIGTGYFTERFNEVYKKYLESNVC